MRCPVCEQDNPPAAAFCVWDGTPLARQPTCARCGAVARAAARFCAQCGSPVVTTAAPVGTGIFTPSEVVLLHGAQFGHPGWFLAGEREQLLGTGLKVDRPRLALKALTAALLANEQAEVLQLDMVELPSLLGHLAVPMATARGTSRLYPWPPASLEARFAALVGDAPVKIEALVHAVFTKNETRILQATLNQIKSGLAERGLLARQGSDKYSLPSSTGALLASTPAPPVQELLTRCKQSRAALWKDLRQQMIAALAARQPWVMRTGDDEVKEQLERVAYE